MTDLDELRSLQHQLENKRETLLLIQERKSEYALSTDIPLDLIREERETQEEIAGLEAQIKTLKQAKPPAAAAPPAAAPVARPKAHPASTAKAKPRSSGGCLLGMGVVLMVVALLIILPRLLNRGTGTSMKNSQATATLSAATSEAATSPAATSLPQAVRPEATRAAAGGLPAAEKSPAAGASLPTLAVTKPTPTPTPPAAVNLTNNREGAYANLHLLIDQAGALHLVYRTVLLRKEEDLFHHQRLQDGSWTPADILTADMKDVFNYSELRLNAKGQLCVLWEGFDERGGSGNYMRCQTGPDWLKTPMRQWPGPRVNAYKSTLIRPDDAVDVLSSWKSSARAVEFNDAVIARDDRADLVSPRLVRDANGGYHALWLRRGKPKSLEHSRSTDGGKAWSEAERLTVESDEPSGNSFAVVADGLGAVHLAWWGYAAAVGHLNYRRWTADAGWSEPVELAGSVSEPPEIAVDSQGRVHVVWSKGCAIWLAAQGSDGSWPAPRPISSTPGCGKRWPRIAVDAEGRSHVVWLDNDDIYYTVVD